MKQRREKSRKRDGTRGRVRVIHTSEGQVGRSDAILFVNLCHHRQLVDGAFPTQRVEKARHVWQYGRTGRNTLK